MISDGMLRAIQRLGESFMKTPVDVYHRQAFSVDSDVWPTDSGDGDYFDDTVRWTGPVTVLGWLLSTEQTDNDNEGYQILTINQNRLRVPVGTVIRSGDRVTIDGEDYSVIDSSVETTWPEWTRVTLEKGQ